MLTFGSMNSRIYHPRNIGAAWRHALRNGPVLVERRDGITFKWLGARRTSRMPRNVQCMFTSGKAYPWPRYTSGLLFYVTN